MQVLLLLDVDFMISSSLNEIQHSDWLYRVVSQDMLVVLPAFEPVGDDLHSQEAIIRACHGKHMTWQTRQNRHGSNQSVGFWSEVQHSSWLRTVVSQGVLVVLPAFEPVGDDSHSQEVIIRACQGEHIA